MTCHPEHYVVENGRRHVVDLSSCVRQRTVAAAQRVWAERRTGYEDLAQERGAQWEEPQEPGVPDSSRPFRFRTVHVGCFLRDGSSLRTTMRLVLLAPGSVSADAE